MEAYETLVELSKCLVSAKKKEDKAFLIKLIQSIYDREIKDETPSKIEDLETKISKLSLKVGMSSD